MFCKVGNRDNWEGKEESEKKQNGKPDSDC